MIPRFKIDKTNLRYLKVVGSHPESLHNIYAPVFTDTEGEFTFEDTIALNGLYSINSEEEYTYVDAQFAEHKSDLFEDSTFEITKDGLYEVRHLVLPTEKWLDHFTGETYKGIKAKDTYRVMASDVDIDAIVNVNLTSDGTTVSYIASSTGVGIYKDAQNVDTIKLEFFHDLLSITNLTDSDLPFTTITFDIEDEDSVVYSMPDASTYKMPYSAIIYYDTTDLKIYSKKISSSSVSTEDLTTGFTEISISALLELDLTTDIYSVYREDQYTFVIPDLLTCLFNIDSQLLDKLCPKSCKTDEYSDLIYKRDLLWMAIHCIRYMLELGSFYEALAILEQFETCGSICSDTNLGGSNCGCSGK